MHRMDENFIAAYLLASLALVTAGSYGLGRLSRHSRNYLVSAVSMGFGVLTPFVSAGGLFAFVPPARTGVYNLLPFCAAVLLVPVSATAAL